MLQFALLLARSLGRTLAELEQSMSAQEFGLHLAEYLRSPWDETRADLRAGLICSTLANIHRGKDQTPYKPADFMPYVNRPDPGHEPDSNEVRQFFGS